MSSPDPQPRQLARWARGGARRPRLWPRLRADLRKVSGVRGWDGGLGEAGLPPARWYESGWTPRFAYEVGKKLVVEGL
ncbi:hypothetical protein BI335_14085, partial [Enemella evansiae]